jgi:SSS family solute:Na+ symporter
MEAFAATIVGVLIILWLSLSKFIPIEFSYLRNPLHANMIIVVGTLSIFLSGALIAKLKGKSK